MKSGARVNSEAMHLAEDSVGCTVRKNIGTSIWVIYPESRLPLEITFVDKKKFQIMNYNTCIVNIIMIICQSKYTNI